MKNETTLNLELLESVNVIDKMVAYDYSWFERGVTWWKRFFWGEPRVQGYYYAHSPAWGKKPLTVQELNDKGYVVANIGKVVYHKPYVKLRYASGKEYVKSFLTLTEADLWALQWVIGIKNPKVLT